MKRNFQGRALEAFAKAHLKLQRRRKHSWSWRLKTVASARPKWGEP